jgi:pseudouridine-5'-phosphate glycosidase
MTSIRIGARVAGALDAGTPVVALESTIFSHLGLPSPANQEALERCLAAIETNGAVPAITAVLDGTLCVGLEPAEHPRILGPARKTAERDLAVAVAQRWDVGATTVSASLALCAATGIRVFATGGIGGVHIGAETSGDISGDLTAIARHPVLTVSAGAKAFLDIPRTLELLETLGVPVLGYETDEFPMFYSRRSGAPVAHRVDDPGQVAAIVSARSALGAGGVLLGVPVPVAAEIAAAEIGPARDAALARAAAAGITGPAVTPYVLEQIAAVTAGRSIPTNLALAEHNAAVAASVAVALKTRGR